jgi:hypothetical protein
MKPKQTISIKVSNMNFHENPTGWSRVILCGRTKGRITLLRVTFRIFLRKRFITYRWKCWKISILIFFTFFGIYRLASALSDAVLLKSAYDCRLVV